MRIAIDGRVSTRDKDQNPETQLLRLRQAVAQHPDWPMTQTYVTPGQRQRLGATAGLKTPAR
jgi:hypothetical protein